MLLSNKLKKWLISLFLLATVGLFFLWKWLPDGDFHIYFLDVGQGDAILIITPENHQILIDGGPENKVMEELSDVMPFFDKTIDMVVLTHPHADHLDGLVPVLKRYEVGSVLLTGVNTNNPTYSEFFYEINQQEIPIFIAEKDMDFLFGDVVLDIIYPFESLSGQTVEDLNNSSIAMRVLYENEVILLTGDLEKEGEAELVAAGVPLKSDIYKAGHHGSRSSSSWDFLQKVMPETVVIQCGEDNKHGHPHPETLRNFFRINVKSTFRNDLDERIEFSF